MQSNYQQEIIRHPLRVIILSQVHQKNIRLQARLEPIRLQAEAATGVAETVVAAVLEVADLAHQTTDLDK